MIDLKLVTSTTWPKYFFFKSLITSYFRYVMFEVKIFHPLKMVNMLSTGCRIDVRHENLWMWNFFCWWIFGLNSGMEFMWPWFEVLEKFINIWGTKIWKIQLKFYFTSLPISTSFKSLTCKIQNYFTLSYSWFLNINLQNFK